MSGSIFMFPRWTAGAGLARAAAALCLVFIIGFPSRTLADEPLKFSDPQVTAYLRELARFRDQYLAAVAAAKHGDNAELKRLDTQFPALQDKAVRLLDKLEPAATKRFTEYVARCGQTMMDAAYGLSETHLR
jgi:uncharacterized membrane protein YccC